MQKKYLSFLLCFIIFSNSLFASALPDISADGAILIEPKTNTIIYSKNMYQTFYPASTTKILTALAVLQDLPTDMIITKTQTAADEVPADSSQIGLKVGDQYTVLDGLYAVLMASDNYVCYDLALADKGNISAFAKRMNGLAIDSNALFSHFINPHGYHDPDHYTTPYDLSQIAKAAFDDPILTKIAGTSSYNFKVANSDVVIPLTHTSALLDKNSPYYNPHVVASKTGYHTPAGRTLVAKAVYDNIELIGVVMRTDAPNQFEDMNKLFEYGASNFTLSTHVKGFDYLTNHTYSNWAKPYVTQALQEGWITNTTHNYLSPITKREFVTLLKSATPTSYNSLLENIIQFNGSSIYKENLKTTRGEAAKVLYQFLSQLDLANILPSKTIVDLDQTTDSYAKAIQFCVDIGIMSINENGYFGPNEPLSYENALCIVSKVNDIIKRYDSYGLPVS
ncbi:S-layer homology domain-containing protein [Cellulosilyticum sp. ST5]|uniref:S-layer homology domain-containing protein n=1 Tax=Cellulosilyticum sp. ST5 TaxID=3055805 RepID=UPI0039779AEC